MDTDLDARTARLATTDAALALTEQLIAKALAPTPGEMASLLAQRLGPRRAAEHLDRLMKAPVPGNDFSGAMQPQPYSGQFLATAASRTPSVFQRLQTLGARPAPMNSSVSAASQSARAYLIGGGTPIPLSRGSFATVPLIPATIAALCAFVNELLRSPSASAIVLRDLGAATIVGVDWYLLDAEPAVPHVRPAGLLYGVTPSGTGGGFATIEDDLNAALAALSGGQAIAPVIVAESAALLSMLSLRTASGEPVFPDVTVSGGTYGGIPIIPSPGADDRLIVLDADAVVYADEGVELGRGEAAAIEMDDSPVNNSMSGTVASLVSMFQTNSSALRSVRYVSWGRGRADAAQYVSLA